MLIKKRSEAPYSAVTPRDTYFNRRRFLTASARLALAGAGAFEAFSKPAATAHGRKLAVRLSSFSTTEKLTPIQDVLNYNNFYELPAERSWRIM
jgi:sulfoxide reductase catalytic subunit YedY